MNAKMEEMLRITEDIHIPIPLDESEMAELRMAEKPVLKSRLLDDMESLDTWRPVTKMAHIELTDERCVTGAHSLKFSAPTNLHRWDNDQGKKEESDIADDSSRSGEAMYAQGRIYGVPAARRDFDREDWRDYNRLSAWVYPDIPGMKSIMLRIQLFNDGAHKVPDRFIRDGAHNMALKNGEWNHVVLEMPYLDRDCVTGVAFEYDMVGHENDAADTVVFCLDKLELQEVEADVFEGWIPAKDRISYCHSGYQPGSKKTAIASGAAGDAFRVIDAQTGRVVLKKKIEISESRFGTLQVMDFSEITKEGEYILIAGDLISRTIPIRHDVWESSVWKMINFYLALRCGYEVPGKHRKCHSDMLLKHGDLSIVCDGGWHDAGDLAQGLNNTSDAARALFALAESVKDTGNDRLYKRVLEEAKWGLDYVLKMRFPDGYRATYSSCSIWSDGIIGTDDDVTQEPTANPFTDFDAACAEAAGAESFLGIDDTYAAYALKIAKADFACGIQLLDEQLAKTPEEAKARLTGKAAEGRSAAGEASEKLIAGEYMIEVQVCSAGASAAARLYRLTGEQYYADQAKRLGEIIIGCQEQEIKEDWDLKTTGFFYRDRSKELIWHHNHHSFSCFPDIALRDLCETFPDAPEYIDWYAAIVRSGRYYASMMQYTAPYGMVPAGIYRTDEAENFKAAVMRNHPMGDSRMMAEYSRYVKGGQKIAEDTYVKVYPVWFSFRGNYNVMLSEAKAISTAAKLRNCPDLQQTAIEQYAWIVGKNPMAQSTLYGEGHDYIQLYTVQPGVTVGAISVGMESHFDRDEPYWPQVNNATYKEVWIGSATKWIWNMADNLLPAAVSGYLDYKGKEVSFIRESGERYAVTTHARTGYYEITLPAGRYRMRCGEDCRTLTVVSGKQYQIDGALTDLSVKAVRDGRRVTITLTASDSLAVSLRAFNVAGLPQQVEVSGSVTLCGELIDEKQPYIGLALPNGSLADKAEWIDERLK